MLQSRRFLQPAFSILCGMLLALALLAPSAQAQNTTYWETGVGDFLVNGNWSDSAPGLGDFDQGFFVINNAGTANLSAARNISGGGLGDYLASSGTLNILSGGNLVSEWKNDPIGDFGDVYVGGYGTGALNIFAGGSMSNYSLSLANQAGSAGVVTMQGGTLVNDHNLTVGESGTGSLALSNNASATNLNILIGKNVGSTGVVTVSSSTLIASGSLSVGLAGSGVLSVSNQSYVSSGSAVIGDSAGVSGQVSLDNSTWNNTADLIIGSSGTGSVLVQNGGALTVGGNATLSNNVGSSGSVTVDNGSWSVGQFLTIGENAAASVTVNASGTLSAAAIFVSTDSSLPASTLTINGGTVIAGQIAGLSNGSVTFTNGTLRFTQDNAGYFAGFTDGSVTLSGSAVTFDTQQYHVATTVALSGTARLLKTGGGRLELSGASTYTGGTYLQAGEILINNGSAIGSGALEMDSAELRSTADATLALPQITVNSGQNGVFSTAENTTLTLSSGTFSLGENAFFRVGSAGNTGTVVFNPTAVVAQRPGTGTISVGYGTLRAGNQQLSALASQVEKVFIVRGATLDFNDQTAGGSVNALFGDGTLHTGTQSATALTVLSGSFGGVISGVGSFVKAGSGTLTFSGTQISTGGITVQAGTFLISGEANNIVVDGGTLGGTGLVDDVITLSSGILAPGGSLGTLSAYAMEWAGGIMQYNLGPASASGHLSLLADLAGNGGQYLFNFLDEGTELGATYNLISFQSSQIALGDFGVANTDGFAGNFSYNGNTLEFTVTALPVPEPGTLSFLSAALGGVLLWRRKASGQKA
ncbi:hypothetical protein BH09VER1_BH09VER1_03280 [soil metagenome]